MYSSRASLALTPNLWLYRPTLGGLAAPADSIDCALKWSSVLLGLASFGVMKEGGCYRHSSPTDLEPAEYRIKAAFADSQLTAIPTSHSRQTFQLTQFAEEIITMVAQAHRYSSPLFTASTAPETRLAEQTAPGVRRHVERRTGTAVGLAHSDCGHRGQGVGQRVHRAGSQVVSGEQELLTS